MYLLIDYREKDFINKLSEYTIIENEIVKSIKINNIDLIFKITNLLVGDFIIQQSLDDTNTIQMVIERKSIRDLCSSITDGRFREQKQRLLESINDPLKISYIIEGNKIAGESKSKNVLSQTIINGSILNLIYKHNYRVIQTENKMDTFNNIILLYKKLTNDEFSILSNNTNVKLIKRSDKIKSEKLINQLCLISGVSCSVAQAIISGFTIIEQIDTEEKVDVTIKMIIDKYNSLELQLDKEMMFSEIEIISSVGRKRKLGKALSKKIYEYFCK